MLKKINVKRMVTVLVPLIVFDLINAFFILQKTYGNFDAAQAPVTTMILFFTMLHSIALFAGIIVISWLNKDSFYTKLAVSRGLVLVAIVPIWLLLFGAGCMDSSMADTNTIFALMDTAKMSFWWLPLATYAIIIPLIILREKQNIDIS